MGTDGESGSERVERLLREARSAAVLVRLDASARTAAEAAAAIGCAVEQIAKSLIFKGAQSGAAILAIASGSIRVDEAKIAQAAGEPIAKADARFVREQTGYAIGGVAPIGHLRPPKAIFLDIGLSRLDPLWAAAGHPHIVFRSTYAELARLTQGRTIEMAGEMG